MKNTLSQNIIRLAESCPYPLYLVGGRVRDFLAGISAQKPDNDICAPADAEDFVERAKAAGFTVDAVYKNTGTVKLRCGDEDYEFTSFRSDEYKRGEHRPYKTFFTDDITLDAKRRDFKCNAVYFDISAGQFVDPLGGIADVKSKICSTVAPADKVFGEDGLRLMRLARICAQTGFSPDADCLAGATTNARLIEDISPERIFAELWQILHADFKYGVKWAQYRGLKLLHEIGVFKIILPEIALGEGMVQPAAYHNYDVLEHSMRAVGYADKRVRLAALLHDAGKPFCKLRDGNYHKHDIEGERIALDICARLRVSKKLSSETARLVSLHMYDLAGNARESKVRKFIVKNYDCFEDLTALKQADYSACKDDVAVAPTVKKMTDILNAMQSEGVPLTLKQLCVRGDELIFIGVPKERTGEILSKLLEECAINSVKNSKSELLNYALNLANRL